MSRPLRFASLLSVALALAVFGWLGFQHWPRHDSPAPPPPADEVPRDVAGLSPLARAPDWSRLEAFQFTITRAEFEWFLSHVFVVGEAWREFMSVDDAGVTIRTGEADDGAFRLHFAPWNITAPVPRTWTPAAELPPAPEDQPLRGLRVAIDPGHLGGPWAQLEERWFVVNGGKPVCEGDLTLQVARRLQPALTQLGASVTLVRNDSRPVTRWRPQALMKLARQTAEPGASPKVLGKLAQRLFYRTAEIHARAERVNHTIRPDLVVCLHFNAEAWGNPYQPSLVPASHLHLLVNGAYTADEIALADQRFALLEKLLRRTHAEESAVAVSVADTFAAASGLPPFLYQPDSMKALPVANHPYVWARNLLANRLYHCPVVFLEPYVMNSSTDYARIQAGDYDGHRNINGRMMPSIFREYADAVAAGLAKHYAGRRRRASP